MGLGRVVDRAKKSVRRAAPYAAGGVMLGPFAKQIKEAILPGAPKGPHYNNRAEQALLDRVDRLYGITPAGATAEQIAEATHNKAALDSILAGQRSAALAGGLHDLGDRFGTTWRTTLQNEAGQGLIGGSADRSARRRMLADLFRGRSRLALGADTADRAARSGLTSRRMDLQRQIKMGTAPSLDTINAVGDQRGAIDEAYHGLSQAALGDLFANAGNTYYSSQEAAGYGRAGPTAFRLGRTNRHSTTGTYLG